MASTSALSTSTPGRSQKGCLVDRTSGTSPNCIDQVDRYECRQLLSEDAQSAKMSDWSDSVLAAEATKAGSASEVTRLIPRPPSRTGRLACIHCVSERLELVICWIECLSSPSNLPREGLLLFYFYFYYYKPSTF